MIPASKNSNVQWCFTEPLYFKNLFSHKKVSEILESGLLQNFRSRVNDTISDLNGNFL